MDTRTARKLAAARGHKLGRFAPSYTASCDPFSPGRVHIGARAVCEHCEASASTYDRNSPAFTAGCRGTTAAAPARSTPDPTPGTQRVFAAFTVWRDSATQWQPEDIALQIEDATQSGAFTAATVWNSLADFDADRAAGRLPSDTADCKKPDAAARPATDIYTAEGKRLWIKEFCSAFERDMLALVERMPDAWDGHELREVFADLAQQCRATSMMTRRRGTRGAQYQNERIVRNLP